MKQTEILKDFTLAGDPAPEYLTIGLTGSYGLDRLPYTFYSHKKHKYRFFYNHETLDAVLRYPLGDGIVWYVGKIETREQLDILLSSRKWGKS